MLSGLSVTLLNKEQLESTRKQFKSSSIIVTSAEVLFTQPLQSGPDVRNTVCVCVCVCECACVPVCVCVWGGGGVPVRGLLQFFQVSLPQIPK